MRVVARWLWEGINEKPQRLGILGLTYLGRSSHNRGRVHEGRRDLGGLAIEVET